MALIGTATHLIDKSAYVRLGSRPVRLAVTELADANRLAVCDMIAMEILYSARSAVDYEAVAGDLGAMPRAPMSAETWTRALTLQHTLARVGQHRRPIPDLLIAATALQSDLTVLHYDRDFEVIAAHSTLRQQWVAPPGSVD